MTFSNFYLRPALPFRLDLTVWALRRMPHNSIDRWDGRTYERALMLKGALTKVGISQPDRSRLLVQASALCSAPMKKDVLPVVERLLGIRTDLRAFDAFASGIPVLAALARDFRGFKPPRFPTVYEAIINAIACQQISLHVCIVLLGRLATTWGKTWSGDGKVLHAFPLPADLSGATIQELRALGFSSSKARAIIGVSQEVASGRFDPEQLEQKTDDEVMQVLTALPGIGPWSAEYVMLRGLGRTHIFPGRDSGALRSLQLLLNLKERPGPARTARITAAWNPFAGLIYFHFLLNKLRSKELLAA